MFSVELISNEAPPPSKTPSWEKQDFPSVIPGRSVVYFQPDEIRMGAYVWKVALFDNHAAHTTGTYPKLADTYGDVGIVRPDHFQPWSSNGETVSFATWNGQHFNYSFSEKTAVKSGVDGGVAALLWSPSLPLYLVTVHRQSPAQSKVCFLADQTGIPLLQIDISLLSDESSSFWWLKSGTAFLALYRRSKASGPHLEIFDARSGQSTGATLVEPKKFAPYDEAEYRDVSRDGYSLEISRSTGCVGYFLDTWHECHFDPETNQLYGAVYRPNGKRTTRNGHGQIVISVSKKWCRFQIVL